MMDLITPPTEYEEIGTVYSNFGHELDDGVAKRLETEKVSAAHCAWDFWALIWKDQTTGKWHEMVKQYREHVDTLTADTLKDVIEATNEKYGNG
jgi:hypothetical protein